ncbi:constitutive coactivator of peroxisome proliferator-activated receptor gamma-like [Schistocerca nitens]|uniref:constitutive coactivator of peroxisome proliferator-activated receptor gamma-like n=1 Tax=Schistocerca nitens TaxID=7011 RepID=UPI002117B405|nr:constitutive coactivator of peroxisome proliferator-activated receptor gamma-like [Schistocerca nitens]
MGCFSILQYAQRHELYEEVDLAEIADECRKKTGQTPVVVVDGRQCVWLLYRGCDFYCGGQYKEFREACTNLVRRFRNCGVHLVFYFYGLPSVDKKEKWVRLNRESAEQMSKSLRTAHEQGSTRVRPKRHPEGLVPCAHVIFREEPNSEVRLSTGICHQEIAQYAASNTNCLGVMSGNADFLVYSGVPSLLILHGESKAEEGVSLRRFRPAVIASHLGIRLQHLPAFGTFAGDSFIKSDELQRVHGRLQDFYNCRGNPMAAVAKLVKDNAVDEMCRIAFGDRWAEFLETVEVGIGQYGCKPTVSDSPTEGSDWSQVLHFIESKHVSGEIPGMVLSLAKSRIFRAGAALEDMADGAQNGLSTAEMLQPMRRRMYTVLLWESGEGPFRVEEFFTRRSDVCQEEVEVSKWLPPGVTHPGLRRLWTADVESRWRLFTWIVGAPDGDGSALRSLQPQYLAVPAAALSFLRHEACCLERHEAEVLAVVAVTVGRLSVQQLAQKQLPSLDTRAVYLASLFVRTALQVLDAAAICGLSFPRDSECLLDAYFDGIFFHELYLKAKAQSFARIGAHLPRDRPHLGPLHHLLDVIEGTHTSRQ